MWEMVVKDGLDDFALDIRLFLMFTQGRRISRLYPNHPSPEPESIEKSGPEQ